MCRGGRLEETLMRKAARALAARRSRRTVLGKFLKYVKKHAFLLVGKVKVNDAQHNYPTDCFVLGFQHCDGSLIQPLWVQPNHPHVAMLTLYLRVAQKRPSKFLERKELVPSLVPLFPCKSS